MTIKSHEMTTYRLHNLMTDYFVESNVILEAVIRQFDETWRGADCGAARPVYINVQWHDIKNLHCRCTENRLYAQLVLFFTSPPPPPFVFIRSFRTLTSEAIDDQILDCYSGTLFHCFLRLLFWRVICM